MKLVNIVWISCIFHTLSLAQETLRFNSPLNCNETFLLKENLQPLASQYFDIYQLESSATISKNELEDLATSSYMSFEHRAKDLFSYIIQNHLVSKDTIFHQMALIAFEDNDFQEAIRYFQQLQESSRINNNTAQFLYAYSLFATKEFQLSKEIFEVLRNKQGLFSSHACYYSGMSSFFLGKPDEAIALLSQVDQTEPFKNYTPYYLAQLYYSQGKYLNCQQYIEAIPSNDRNLEMYRILGQASFMLEDYQKADKNLTKYLSTNTGFTSELYFQLAYASYKLQKNDKAKKFFNKIALENNQLSFLANYYLTDLYYQDEAYLKALASTEQLIAQSQDEKLSQNLRYNAGMLAYQTASYRKALDHFNQVSLQSSYRYEANQYINQILQSSEDLDGSIRFIEQLDDKHDFKQTYHELVLKKSRQAFNEAEYSVAKGNLDKISSDTATEKMKSEKNYLLGRIALQAKNTTLAKNQFKRIKQGESKYPFAQYYLGNIFQEELLFDDAIKSYKLSLDHITSSNYSAPVSDNIYLQLAEISLINNDYKNGLKNLKKTTQKSTKVKDYILYISAYQAGKKGDLQQQKNYLTQLTSEYPNSRYTQKANVELAQLYTQENNVDKALDILNQLSNSNDRNIAGDALLQQALLYYNNNQLKESIKLYKRVVETPSTTNQKLSAIAALKEIYLNDLNETNTLFTYLSTNTDYEISSIAKDSLSFKTAHNHVTKGEYHKSIIQLESYLSSYPNGLYIDEAQYTIAESYALLKENQSAYTYYQKVIANPNSIYQLKSTKKAAIIALNQLQDYSSALSYFKSIYKHSSDEAVQLEAAESGLYCSFKLGQVDDIITYGQIVAEHPASTQKNKAKAYYYLGKTQQSASPDQAIKAFNKVVQLLGPAHNISAESTYLLASIFYQKSDLEATERQCLEAIKRASKYPKWVAKSLLLLSDVYLDKEDYLNAKATSEAVIENYKEDASIYQEATDKLILINAAYKKNHLKEDQTNQVEFQDIQNEN